MTAALTALTLLAVPAGAVAKKPPPPSKRSGDQQYCNPFPGKKGIAYEARGTVKAVDVGAGQVTLTIGKRYNRHARKWSTVDVAFLVNCAKLKVRDTNGDGKRDLSDVKVGARAEVLAKLPRSLGSLQQPFVAKELRVR